MYLKGNEVSHNSIRFVSKWWNINEIPGENEWGPWEEIKN
ncbi:hypothetical protein EIJ81_07970 [Aliivibrio salmonicida]|nr:hypothetical protein EIJ81_07970 [Aliivibrio salmonicida]